MVALIALLFGLSVLLAVAGVRDLRHRPGQDALRRHFPAGEAGPPPSSFDRYIRPLARRAAQRVRLPARLAEAAQTERLLVLAGRPARLSAEEFLGVRLLGAGLGLFWGLYFFVLGLPMSLPVGLGGALAGFMLPRSWLAGRAQQRQAEISLGMPSLLDLLAVCIQAGMGFDLALANVAQRSRGPLAEELVATMRQIRLGEPRRQAFQALVERNTAEELRGFMGAVLQAEELGVPLAQTLETQASQLRFRRAERAKELAAKASPKVSLVAVGLIAPSALIMFVAVLVLNLLSGGFGGVFGP